MTAATSETFDPAKYPRKLNLGCGFDHRTGYVNVDLNVWHKPDLLADARKLAFLPAKYYDEIVAQDVLEHLPRTDTLATLAHWNRPLKIGGRILIRVPSILGVADLLERPENHGIAKQEELIQCLFGTQAYTGDFHFTSFTEPLLEHYLKTAGFRVATIGLLDGWLFDVEGEKIAHIEAPQLRDFSELANIGNDGEFIDACYREILQRESDPAGREFYANGIRSGMSRQDVIALIVTSTEYTERFPRVT